MRILITGICGFVGSNLSLALREQSPADELSITGIDNLSRAGSWVNRERLQKLGIDVVHGDLRCSSDLDSFDRFDWVIDAAANPSVLAGVDGKSNSRQLVEHNLGGTINMLEACKRWNAGFVLLSTSRVYSIPPLADLTVEVQDNAFRPRLQDDLPPGCSGFGIAEDFSTASPVSLYGATKLASETLALEYSSAFGFPVWINRCGVMAGAGQFGRADQGIFAFWLHSWRESRKLKYIGFGGHGHQVRDCLHPKDLAPLLNQQFNRSPSPKDAIVNISGGIESAMSLAQLSAWCRDRWGERDVAVDGTPRRYDLPWVVLDNRMAHRVFDWRPQISTRDILNEIAEFADRQSDWIALSM